MAKGFDFPTPLRDSANPTQFRSDFLQPASLFGAHGCCTETMRGLPQYSDFLGFEPGAFVDFLPGKRVLDVGSGCGGLAKECAENKIDCEIYSVNPRLSKPEWRQNERAMTIRHGFRVDVQAVHDTYAVAAWAHELPFADKVFDAIFDVIAVVNYSAKKSELRANVREMLRVLKPGGILLSGLIPHTALSRIRYIEKEFGVQNIKHRHKAGYGDLTGFQLTKVA